MVQPLIPNQPYGQPDWYSPPGYGAGSGAGYGSPSAPAAGGSYQYDGQTVPRATPEDPYAEVRWWRMHEADVTDKALKEQNAFNKQQLENQRIDAAAALKNAMAIAQLNEQASRYGTDVGSRDRLAALEVNQQQFRANHQLAQAELGIKQADLGLRTADSYTKYAQTYDDLYALQDMKGALANIQAGGSPAPYGSQGQPQAKSWESYAALTGFGNVPGVQQQGVGAGQGAAAGGGAGTGTDPRMSAANAVMKALPPSGEMGHTDQDFAALNAIQSLYFGAKPGQVEALGSERQKAARGGLARLGWNPRLVEEERNRSLPGQGSVRAY